jgi:hypothetical protein
VRSHFKASAAIAAAVLAATVVVLVAAATKPAGAAFPGPSGAIAYTRSEGGPLESGGWRPTASGRPN